MRSWSALVILRVVGLIPIVGGLVTFVASAFGVGALAIAGWRGGSKADTDGDRRGHQVNGDPSPTSRDISAVASAGSLSPSWLEEAS